MHYTREPTVETVITPREGCKLVVRSSRGVGGEEFFVDAVEVVVFGDSCFFRSLEKPKSFLLPVSDYEVLEVRETRMVLKAASGEKSRRSKPKAEPTPAEEEVKVEKKRERRRQRRRKSVEVPETPELPEPQDEAAPVEPTEAFRALIPPPSRLISEQMGTRVEEEAPELVPPAPQEDGGFRLFRRFRGTEETSSDVGE